MNKKPLMIAVMALGAFACDNREAGTGAGGGSTPGPAATSDTEAAGPATEAVAGQLIRLKLPGMT